MDLPLHYCEFPPPPYLKRYVKSFWSLERVVDQHLQLKFSPIPDGYPGIIFQLGEETTIFDTQGNPFSSIFVFRPMMERKQMILSGKITEIGAYFYPSGLKTIFGFDVSEIEDECLDLSLVRPLEYQKLHEQLRALDNHQSRFLMLSNYFAERIAANQRKNLTVHVALQQILEARGQVQVSQLTSNLRVSERSLERYFKQFIGSSPQKYIRLCRFNAALDDIRQHREQRLTEIAYQHGYADQSHFIREFKTFAGLSPSQFRRGRDEFFDALQIFSPA